MRHVIYSLFYDISIKLIHCHVHPSFNTTNMELSKLVKHLCKVDTIVDNRYAEYRDTQEKYGDSKTLVDYYKQKYQKARRYRESLKQRILELEQSIKHAERQKRKLIVDEEPPAKVAKPAQPTNTMVTENPPASTQLYTPRKEVLTSAYGLRYRHDPDFRERVRNKQKEYRERRKFLYV